MTLFVEMSEESKEKAIAAFDRLNKEFIDKQESLPQDMKKILEDNFWELVLYEES